MQDIRLITSESITEGHPDKVADQISDAVLDSILAEDPAARVAVETVVTTGIAIVVGEITSTVYPNVQKVVREVVRDIGYTGSDMGFDADTCSVMVSLDEQSPDIAMGVDHSTDSASGDLYDQIGAGDQGMMYGYACRETKELMPMPIMLAHKLTMRLTEARKKGELSYLRPDGKAQVTVEYVNGVPKRVHTVVVSTQHDPDVDIKTLRKDVTEKIIKQAIPAELMSEETLIYVNPTGRFVTGGPHGDSGLTGRKIIVDTYGGYCPHGGGAFSGKDPTKVDRSAAYMARYVCKNMVAAGAADRMQLEVSYAIGVAHPISLHVNTFGTGVLPDAQLQEIVRKVFDMRPSAIIDTLALRKPIYRATANYGHFGRDGFPWEKTDKVQEIRALLGK
ncbi:MAG TPA: methionine adenosyltransferase [Clostridiales bacterium]|nr:methionine adenosyltransferase [Clostridiales bacterium]